MTVHFICRGNVYRSRLAESYLKSLKLDNIQVSSSGIEASKNLSGIIAWYTQRIIQKNHLVVFEKQNWDQTTQELIDKSDLIIFMSSDINDFCKANFNLVGKQTQTWNIEDLIRVFDVTEAVSKTEESFEKIKLQVVGLRAHLVHKTGKSE